jgi:hypothetical protein
MKSVEKKLLNRLISVSIPAIRTFNQIGYKDAHHPTHNIARNTHTPIYMKKVEIYI